jgi:tRNA(fMet)-specific endonuclease VapC
VLVDTNIVIAMFAGDPVVIEALESKDDLFLCIPVLGELFYGALASTRVQQNVARIQEFVQAVIVLDCDTKTAARYGEVKNYLRRKGKPIPENDVWIAALARQHQLTLLTRDTHFGAVDDLDWETC